MELLFCFSYLIFDMLSTNSFQEIKKDNNNLFIGFEEKKFAGFLGRISHFSGIIYTSYIL